MDDPFVGTHFPHLHPTYRSSSDLDSFCGTILRALRPFAALHSSQLRTWLISIFRYNYLPPHFYIACCVMAWGLTASLQALTRSFAEMLILRLLLGVSEAAFSPGVPFYLSFFYRREELALRVGLQVSAAPLAASFAGSLAWAITRLGRGGPLAPWRLLFLVEGFPSVLTAVLAWSFIPDSPDTAKFLNERQRNIASVRLRSQASTDKSSKYHDTALKKQKRKGIDWREIWDTLKDPKCYLTAVYALRRHREEANSS